MTDYLKVGGNILQCDITQKEVDDNKELETNLFSTKKKLRLAISRFIRSEPFFASMLLSTNNIISLRVPTAATSGTEIFYNPNFVANLTVEETKALVAHELMHDAFLHSVRLRKKHPLAWNVACDYVINLELNSAGFQLPKGFLMDFQYQGFSSEQVYETLDVKTVTVPVVGTGAESEQTTGGSKRAQEQEESAKGDPNYSQRQDGAPGEVVIEKKTAEGSLESDSCIDTTKLDEILPTKGKANDPGKEKKAEQAIRERVEDAIRSAKTAGNESGNIIRKIKAEHEDFEESQIDWKELLRTFVSDSVGMDDYTWAKPNLKFQHLGVCLPSLTGERINEFVIGVDTSGSINRQQLAKFGETLTEIIRELPDAVEPEVTVMFCDTSVKDTQKITKSDLPVNFKPIGGGGTRFRPVFNEVKKLGLKPRCLIYFTDLYCSDWPEKPNFPVKWLAFNDPQETKRIIEYAKAGRGYQGGIPEWIVDGIVSMGEDSKKKGLPRKPIRR